MTAWKPAQQTDTAFQGHPMEHPFSLHPIRRRPLATKKLAARTARLAARQALRFALLPPLPTIPDVEFLTPNSPKYDQYLAASNLRTTQRPALRALCKTGQSVAAVLDWVRTNGLPFAVRSGGHSYEGFSQSMNVVIDTRLIDSVTLDPGSETVTVGAGASLGTVYKALKDTGFAFAAGSCPTVGVAGHALGGRGIDWQVWLPLCGRHGKARSHRGEVDQGFRSREPRRGG
jgi:FAD binding domain